MALSNATLKSFKSIKDYLPIQNPENTVQKFICVFIVLHQPVLQEVQASRFAQNALISIFYHAGKNKDNIEAILKKILANTSFVIHIIKFRKRIKPHFKSGEEVSCKMS